MLSYVFLAIIAFIQFCFCINYFYVLLTQKIPETKTYLFHFDVRFKITYVLLYNYVQSSSIRDSF